MTVSMQLMPTVSDYTVKRAADGADSQASGDSFESLAHATANHTALLTNVDDNYGTILQWHYSSMAYESMLVSVPRKVLYPNM